MADKYLIIQTAFIGDVVLATSLVQTIHAALPGASIDFLVRKGNESLLRGHPHLNDILIWDKKNDKLKNLLGLLRNIRKNRYTAVINIQRYAATGFLTAFSGAKKTVGFDTNPLSFLFKEKVPHTFTGLHEIERNHALVRSFVPGIAKMPALFPSPSDFAHVDHYTQFPFITVSPASVWFTKQYPPQKWAAFLNELPGGVKIYLLGGMGDRSISDAIIQMNADKAPVNLCGELSFLQSAALMSRATMNYVNDSAPMHFASAVNAPVTAIYCSTVPSFGYGPLSAKRFIVEREQPLYCRPCGLHGHTACPQGHFKCALDIREGQLLMTFQSATGHVS